MTQQEINRREQVLQEACNLLAPHSELIAIRREPDATARFNECYENCVEKVNRCGGSIQLGWTFSKVERTVLLAHWHTVWRSPNGTLICITPVPALASLLCTESSDLVFLPDGKSMDKPNRYFPLTSNKALRKACIRWNREEYMINKNPNRCDIIEARIRKAQGICGVP